MLDSVSSTHRELWIATLIVSLSKINKPFQYSIPGYYGTLWYTYKEPHSQRKLTLPPPEAISCPELLSWKVELVNLFFVHARMPSGLILSRSHTSNHSCCEVVITAALSCAEDTFLRSPWHLDLKSASTYIRLPQYFLSFGDWVWYGWVLCGWAFHQHLFSLLSSVVNVCINHCP